jgi:hypothetical protein
VIGMNEELSNVLKKSSAYMIVETSQSSFDSQCKYTGLI